MILNDIWTLVNTLVQSNVNTDFDRKILAINVAQKYLIERMQQLGKKLDEFVSDPTNLTNVVDTHYLSCPDDFLTLIKAWYRVGTRYIPFGRYGYITYDDLTERTGETFFDTTSNGTPNLIAVKEPRFYLDQYLSNTFTDDETITGTTSGETATVDSVSSTTLTYSAASGSFTDGEVITGSTSGTTATITTITATTMVITITGGTKEIKISYINYPDDVVYYDTMDLTSVTGTFQVGEVIEGYTSNNQATILTVAATSLTIISRNGLFQDGETIEGKTSEASAVMDGELTLLNQTLSWSTKYKYMLCEGASLLYEHFKASNNVPARSDIVDGIIEMYSVMNRGEEQTTWSTD